jgi:hypothetical protein
MDVIRPYPREARLITSRLVVTCAGNDARVRCCRGSERHEPMIGPFDLATPVATWDAFQWGEDVMAGTREL